MKLKLRNFAIAALAVLIPFNVIAQEVPSTPVEDRNSNPYMDDQLIVIGTGAISGIYYPAGGAICRVINKERKYLGLRCAAESTPGSIYNINSLKAAEFDFAIIQSDWQEHAVNGTSVFSLDKGFDKLRHLFSLYTEAFTVVVKKSSEIKLFDDLKGKVVNIGTKGSGIQATMEEIMKVKGWSKADFKALSQLKPTEQARALCEGKIDAMIVASGHPNSVVQDVTSMCETRLIDVNGADIQNFVKSNTEYSLVVIPGGMYNGNPKDVTTFGIKATVVSTTDVSEKLAYNLTKAVFENLPKFKTLHPVFATLTAEKMVTEGRTAAFHAGAEQYYAEKGWLKNGTISFDDGKTKVEQPSAAQQQATPEARGGRR